MYRIINEKIRHSIYLSFHSSQQLKQEGKKKKNADYQTLKPVKYSFPEVNLCPQTGIAVNQGVLVILRF